MRFRIEQWKPLPAVHNAYNTYDNNDIRISLNVSYERLYFPLIIIRVGAPAKHSFIHNMYKPNRHTDTLYARMNFA